MVPPSSNRISRVPPYLFAYLVPLINFRLQGYHLLWPSFPECSTNLYAKICQALPRSLAATQGISVDFFSCGYLDVSVPHVRFVTIVTMTHKCAGFPHSDISGSKFICQLPEAFRRLSRLSSPLTAKASAVCAYSLGHYSIINC